ncbi:hypothetical protein [Novosphingobium decolorationis]|uniref:Uncharacterized protein n=1 Tax=Novosphingobium decolorationis TaxID=2698673 RepID=A0ABX8EBN7_9SPHN|nr:hypothetical protein [Novosphingobium decolorationis]QVM86452.1 hypothetical protein HT578_21875 [Novosphingobium decolorationis]
MSEHGTELVLAAILDAITLLRGEVSAIADRQDEIQSRLDHIDAGLAPVTDVLPGLEMVLAHQDADRGFQTEMFRRTAELAALTHAAASGRPSTLPDDLADHPILERFAYFQPSERGSSDVALARWGQTVKVASTEELIEVLKSQYTPSPTEFVDVRVLRFRMAAITRDELQNRSAPLPTEQAPGCMRDGSSMSKQARFAELAALWRAGDSIALQGEAELAGAIDYWIATRERLLSEGQTVAVVDQVMSKLHQKLDDDLVAGSLVARDSNALHEGMALDRDPGLSLPQRG